MKTKSLVSILILVLAVLIIAGSCATEKKMIKESDELYGTWVNEDYKRKNNDSKIIYKSEGIIERYIEVPEEYLQAQGTFFIKNKWEDTEGNIWYNAQCNWEWGKQKFNEFYLIRLSKSGTIYEEIYHSRKYPTEIDSNDLTYRIYYRQ